MIFYSHGIHAANAPMGMSGQATYCCILQGSQLGKVDEHFSPPMKWKLANSDGVSRSGPAWIDSGISNIIFFVYV